MDSELQSPYIESNSSNTLYENSPRVSLQGVGNVPNVPKPYSIFNIDSMGLIISIVVTILILYFIYISYGKTSLFTTTGDLSDPAHDEYLENQIHILNGMQEKNLRS